MTRHLSPDEFDLLVDAASGLETGFGVAPLRAHVRECATCRADLEQAESLASSLELMPHFAPSIGFADRVMTNVPVFEPWHVALADTARRLVPASTPLRVVAASGALAMSALLTTVTLWVLAHADELAFTTDAAAAAVRATLWDALTDAVATLAGSPAQSMGALVFAIAMLGAAIAVAGAGLRAAASVSRQLGATDAS